MKKIIVLITLFTSSFSVFSQTEIVIESTISYQTIDGWEAVSNPLEAASVRDTLLPHIDTLLAIAINDVGITRLRYSLKSGIEDSVDYFTQMMNDEITYDEYKLHRYSKINDNSDPFDINLSGFQFSSFQDNLDNLIVPFKNKVEANDDDFYFNLCFVDFKNQNSFHHTSDPQEYAEFMTAAWLFMDSVYQFTPNGLEVILEPDNSDIWNQTHIPPSIVAAGDRLTGLGYSPEIIAPSLKSIYGIPNYVNAIADNPEALSYLDVISYHRYSGSNDTDAQQEIVNLANLYGKKTSMLEYDYNGNVNNLHYDLKYNNVTAWTKYALMYKSNEKFAYVYVDASNTASPQYGIGAQTKYLRQYFKFIRPGAQRINAITSNPLLDPVAFKNITENQVVVIKAEQGDSIYISGLKPDEYGIKYTLGNYDWGAVEPTNYNVDLPNQTIFSGDTLSFHMPSKGVATIYGINDNPILSVNNHKEEADFIVYPNPAANSLTINNRQRNDVKYSIISLDGKILSSDMIMGNTLKQIDISFLPIGIYLLKTKSKTIKFLKSN